MNLMLTFHFLLPSCRLSPYYRWIYDSDAGDFPLLFVAGSLFVVCTYETPQSDTMQSNREKLYYC